jgi:hypothetical protein
MSTDTAPSGPEADYRLNERGRPVKSVEHTLTAVTSIVGGLARRRRRPDAGLNDGLDLAELTQLVGLRETVEDQLAEAVTDLYAADYSWTDIGRALGVTRQAALKRYGAHVEALAPLVGLARQ